MFVTLKSLGSLDGLGWRVGLAALGVAALATSRAEAMPCAADSDCPAYFTCEVVGTAACATLQSCPAGASCPATPCAPTGSHRSRARSN